MTDSAYAAEAEPRLFEVGCSLDYVVNGPSTFVLNIAPSTVNSQRILSETMDAVPEVEFDHFVELATSTQYHRFSVSEVGRLTIRFDGKVEYRPRLFDPGFILLDTPENVPFEALTYLYPSRYCQSDMLDRLARREFGGISAGYDQILAICDWIRRNVDYIYGTTGPMTSAYETAIARAGVCRDFTHLAIAFCRALNIPARFVSCYAYELDPPDFHAVLEAWLGNRWYLFDPTQLTSPTKLVRIGTGRDAADVAFAFIFGPVAMTDMKVYCHEISGHREDVAPYPRLAVAGI